MKCLSFASVSGLIVRPILISSTNRGSCAANLPNFVGGNLCSFKKRSTRRLICMASPPAVIRFACPNQLEQI
jgi:hypothetical protein